MSEFVHLRAIRGRDFSRVVWVLLGSLGFFWFVIWFGWRSADFGGKVAVLSLQGVFSLFAVRLLVIYWPRKPVDLSALKLVRGPCWSSTCWDTTFVWIEVEEAGRRRKIRLVESAARERDAL